MLQLRVCAKGQSFALALALESGRHAPKLLLLGLLLTTSRSDRIYWPGSGQCSAFFTFNGVNEMPRDAEIARMCRMYNSDDSGIGLTVPDVPYPFPEDDIDEPADLQHLPALFSAFLERHHAEK